MKEFNLAKSINYAVSQPVVKPREVNVDPDRPNFSYLKTTELPKNKQFTMRALPSDPEKNPNGYIVKEMYQFPEELDLESTWMPKHKNRFKMVPGCYKPGAPDYMLGVYKKIQELLDGPTSYDFIPDPDKDLAAKGNGELVLREGESPTRSDMFRDIVQNNKEFGTFLKVISQKWTQVIIPVLLYATADTFKNDQGYDRSNNYQPDEDEEKILPRLIQFNMSKDLKENLLDHFVEKSGSPAVNNPAVGKNIAYIRKDKGHSFAFGKKSKLDEDFEAKLAGNPDYYPNLRERELGRSYEPESIEAALKACPKRYLQPLIDFGCLDTE